MKSLLVMAVVMLALCSCMVDNESKVKFSGGADLSRSVEKYYLGAEDVLAGRGVGQGNYLGHVANSEVDIYAEVDFNSSSGNPVVNLKNSADPNECDQSPPNVFSEVNRTGWIGWRGKRWEGAWTNAKDQRFEVFVTYYPDGEIRLSLSITYDMRDRVAVTRGRYRLQGTLVNEPSGYVIPIEGNPSSRGDRVARAAALGMMGHKKKVDTSSHQYGGRYVSFEDVKQKFSSRDNCGQGGSDAHGGNAYSSDAPDDGGNAYSSDAPDDGGNAHGSDEHGSNAHGSDEHGSNAHGSDEHGNAQTPAEFIAPAPADRGPAREPRVRQQRKKGHR